jgi:hypothetical protein
VSPLSSVSFRSATRCKFYAANLFAFVLGEPSVCRRLKFHVRILRSLFFILRCSKTPYKTEALCTILNKFVSTVGIVSSLPNPEVRWPHLIGSLLLCFRYIFVATLHIWRPFPPSATSARAAARWYITRKKLKRKSEKSIILEVPNSNVNLHICYRYRRSCDFAHTRWETVDISTASVHLILSKSWFTVHLIIQFCMSVTNSAWKLVVKWSRNNQWNKLQAFSGTGTESTFQNHFFRLQISKLSFSSKISIDVFYDNIFSSLRIFLLQSV